jgi:hypothetical protein
LADDPLRLTPPVEGKELPAPHCSVPALIVVPPEYVLPPKRVTLPLTTTLCGVAPESVRAVPGRTSVPPPPPSW